MKVSESSVYPNYYNYYKDLLPQDVSILHLIESRTNHLDFYETIPEQKWDFKYAEDKWSLKKVVRHILDAELIFNYRALSIVRGEQAKLIGWNENEYADFIDDSKLTKEPLIKSLKHQFKYTIDLFSSFDRNDLMKIGNANGHDTEVAAIGFAIISHEIHHRGMIRERYLGV